MIACLCPWGKKGTPCTYQNEPARAPVSALRRRNWNLRTRLKVPQPGHAYIFSVQGLRLRSLSQAMICVSAFTRTAACHFVNVRYWHLADIGSAGSTFLRWRGFSPAAQRPDLKTAGRAYKSVRTGGTSLEVLVYCYGALEKWDEARRCAQQMTENVTKQPGDVLGPLGVSANAAWAEQMDGALRKASRA